MEEILDMRFNKYDNTHIVAMAVNAPCLPSEIYPEDCSFVDIMNQLDPTFNARQRTLSTMNQGSASQSAIASNFAIALRFQCNAMQSQSRSEKLCNAMQFSERLRAIASYFSPILRKFRFISMVTQLDMISVDLNVN